MSLTILIGSIVAIFIIYKYFKVKAESGDEETNRAAKSYDIKVEKVDRLVPITEGYHLNDKLEERECYSYSITLSAPDQLDWKLLQRFGKQHKESDYWVLEKAGDLSEEVMRLIKEFKIDFDEDYFELEARDGRIYLFWEEWGGKRMVDKVVEYLRKFAALSA